MILCTCGESTPLHPAVESFRQGWQEALQGETRPIAELWEDIDAGSHDVSNPG
jgi:hypothetical protein